MIHKVMYLIVYNVFMLIGYTLVFAGNLNMLLNDNDAGNYIHRVIHRLIPAYSLGFAGDLPIATVFSLPAKVYNRRLIVCLISDQPRRD